MNLKLDDVRHQIPHIVSLSLDEDIGSGDITAELIPEEEVASAEVITREECIVCGKAWFDEVFKQLGQIDSIEWHVNEGDRVKENTLLVSLKGNARVLLTGERTALNLLQLLSGIATKSYHYSQKVAHTEIKILDTRKTLPGLRLAQKYAVAVGGSHNHRVGLYDAFLIKENHIKACGSIALAVHKARQLHPKKTVIVEVETLAELQEAIDSKVDRVMLDNFSKEQMQHAFLIDKKSVKYEASGNLDLSTISPEYNTGIDCISIGDLTKNIKCIDLSMRLV